MFSSDIPLNDTPVIEMLFNCYNSEKVSFHMPGHTRENCFPGLTENKSDHLFSGSGFSGKMPDSPGIDMNTLDFNFFALDTTEFELTDDINNPTGPVKVAQVLAAKAFGAYSTFFVTAGSTIAIHAALLCTTKPGDKIIVFRNAHKSVINACIMYGLKLVYTSVENLAVTLDSHGDAALVFLTRPDYYGRCSDIKKIADAVHERGKLLIVDEAHGTHFPFCPSLLPESAITAGGDIVIQSAHKTAPALTQGAYLHITHTLAESDRFPGPDVECAIQESLSRVTTSSPSFLIAASLDYARAYLSKFGESKTFELYDNIHHFYMLLSESWRNCLSDDYKALLDYRHENRVLPEHVEASHALPGHEDENHALPGHEDESHALPIQGRGVLTQRQSVDLFRIVFNLGDMPMSTEMVCSALARDGIYVEFHDARDIVLICKFGNTAENFARLAGVLNKIDNDLNAKYEESAVLSKDDFLAEDDLFAENTIFAENASIDEIEKSLPVLIDNYYRDYSKEIYDFSGVRENIGNVEDVPIDNCVGRTLYSAITPYPPGVPLILPGETVSYEAQQIINDMMKCNMSVNGLAFRFDADSNKSAFIKCIK